ncbi:MAG: ABC transporter ATP-binding protein [Pseudomonadota bacterium]
MEKLLEIKDLSVSFNTLEGVVKVVDNASFSIAREQTLALVGESGSGKSVTAMSILQLHEKNKINYQGEILFRQQNLLKYSEKELRKIRGSQIAMIFQEPMTSLNPTFTVGNQIIEPLMLHEGLSRKAAIKRAIELMDLTGIVDPDKRYDAYPHMLSGGQRQRVMIAMALACKPTLLIADEPTTALDVTVQLQILLLLEKLKKEFSMSVLLITHNLNLVKRFADQVCVMQNGKIVEANSTQALFGKPQQKYTIELLNSEPERVIPEDESSLLESHDVLMSGKDLKCYFPVKSGFFKKTKDYIKAVDDVNIKIRCGETLGIVGESGSGKSTLGRCLLRLQDCSGEISFDGKQIEQMSFSELRPLRKEFQIVFQDPFSSLSPRLTIEQIIGEGLAIHFPELDKQQCNERIIAVLKEVGLDENILWRYPHEFSGGQRQRIAIARVVILEPKLILLDEPTSALDVSVQKQVLALLRKLQLKYKMSYLFITHDLNVIQSVSHHLMVMKDGKIIEAGETEQLFNQPQKEYTKTLLSASLFK